MSKPKVLTQAVLARAVLALAALAVAAPAAAIPALARKYGTSCLTCHTVYPKLNPFGEAFRRNGYHFPGVDFDFVKADQIALGQEASKKLFPEAVWPASIPAAVPLSIGANGQALVIPSKRSTLGRASNGATFSTQDLVGEAHLWSAAALDDDLSLWAELTFGSDGSVDVEHAQIVFANLVGPKHLATLIVGHGFPNLTQYGPHSSYLGDALLTTVPVTAIYLGNQDPWTLVDNYSGAELNGVVAGRLDYALGLNAGKVNGPFATDNFYGRLGFKLGGLRLDGEGSAGAADPLHPWAEEALGVYAFGYRSNSRFEGANGQQNDVASVVGGGLRGQYGSAELNLGASSERHDHGSDTSAAVTSQVAFAELSYVLYPWMVPALRVEYASLRPSGGTRVSDLHLMPGIAFAIRPNIKLVTVLNLERSDGFPAVGGVPVAWQGGASDFGPLQIGPPASGRTRVSEVESLAFFLAWAM